MAAYPIAVVASIIDKVEGNIFYQEQASNGGDHFFKTAYEYTLDQRNKFSEKISSLPDSSEKLAALQILNDQIEYITKLWGK